MIERFKVIPYQDTQVVVHRVSAAMTGKTAELHITLVPSEIGVEWDEIYHTIEIRVVGSNEEPASEVNEELWAEACTEDFAAMMVENFVATQRALEEDNMKNAHVGFTHTAPKTLQ